MTHWIWQCENWPKFTYRADALATALASARLSQGKLLGIIQTMQNDTTTLLDAEILAEQAIDTSAIEGERLNRDSVRSSIADRLGLHRAGIHAAPNRYIDGLLDMLMDATGNHEKPLTLERLFGWHAGLFPTGYAGIHKIIVADLRGPGPMEIVSGQPGKTTIHYSAPPANTLSAQLEDFLTWFNGKRQTDGLIRAGLAHLWFELLHPFEDGNGRVGRAIIDLALAQDEKLSSRYYSLSSAIMRERKHYYSSLEKACRGGLDVTDWLNWFLSCVTQAIEAAMSLIKNITFKSRFWQIHATTALNERQIKVLNKLLSKGEAGFIGNMTTRKYRQITGVSRATAYRELNDLVNKQCLVPTTDKGRAAGYAIAPPPL